MIYHQPLWHLWRILSNVGSPKNRL